MTFRSRVRGNVPGAVAFIRLPPGPRPFATGIFGTVCLIGIVSQQLLSCARKHPPGAPIYACSGEARRTAKNARLIVARTASEPSGLNKPGRPRSRVDVVSRGRGRPGTPGLQRDGSPHRRFFTACANSRPPRRVSAQAGLNRRNHSVTYHLQSTINPFLISVSTGLYSAWERWFGGVVLATQP
jgi:hypothetical protein